MNTSTPARNKSAGLGDAAEAFFREGDEGRYEGGPIDSLAPVMAPDLVIDDAPTPPSPELLARRLRLQRMVTTVVGSLGAAFVLMAAFRLVQGAPEQSEAATLAALSPPEPEASHPEPQVLVETAPAPKALAEPRTETAAVEPPPREPCDPAVASPAGTNRTAKRPSAARNRLAAAAPAPARAPSGAPASRETTPTAQRATTIVSPASSKRHFSSEPPTASFPD